MFYHALTGKNEVETVWNIGKLTLSTSTTTKVTLGYKPKKLLIIHEQNSSTPTITPIQIYDEAVDPNSFKFESASETKNIPLPSTAINRLASIDDDGFTFNKATSSGSLFRYVAIK